MTLPDEKQLRLSEDAVLLMRRILDEFNHQCDSGISLGSTRQRLHQLLAEFFDTFGSHVFRRPAKVEALRWQERGCPARPHPPLLEGRGLLGRHQSLIVCNLFNKQEGPSGTVASSTFAARC